MCIPEADSDSPLVMLMGAIQRFAAVPRLELTPAELGTHLITLRHGVDILELNFAISAAAFATTHEYEAEGSVSPVDWIRHNCHMSAQAAGRAVNAGEQICRLPATAGALDGGDIGFAHFALLAGVARALSDIPLAAAAEAAAADPATGDDATGEDAASEPSDPPVSPSGFDERALLEMAREHSVGRFSFDCTQARHAYDASAALEEHVTNAERNRCEFTDCEGGFVALRGFFDPVAAATLKTAVFPFARRTGAGDTRRLADALVEVASHALDVGAVPAPAGREPTSSSPPRSRRS